MQIFGWYVIFLSKKWCSSWAFICDPFPFFSILLTWYSSSFKTILLNGIWEMGFDFSKNSDPSVSDARFQLVINNVVGSNLFFHVLFWSEKKCFTLWQGNLIHCDCFFSFLFSAVLLTADCKRKISFVHLKYFTLCFLKNKCETHSSKISKNTLN